MSWLETVRTPAAVEVVPPLSVAVVVVTPGTLAVPPVTLKPPLAAIVAPGPMVKAPLLTVTKPPTLPTPFQAGMIACVNDSAVRNWGNNIGTAPGTYTVLVWYNGTQWTVIGQ